MKAVVDCVIDEGRCDQTGEEVKKFAKTAVCMPRYVFSISLHAKVCVLNQSACQGLCSHLSTPKFCEAKDN